MSIKHFLPKKEHFKEIMDSKKTVIILYLLATMFILTSVIMLSMWVSSLDKEINLKQNILNQKLRERNDYELYILGAHDSKESEFLLKEINSNSNYIKDFQARQENDQVAALGTLYMIANEEPPPLEFIDRWRLMSWNERVAEGNGSVIKAHDSVQNDINFISSKEHAKSNIIIGSTILQLFSLILSGLASILEVKKS
ncbi:MAG: hypothetical protein AABW63_02075 [Nanoarchaeota archaeon]